MYKDTISPDINILMAIEAIEKSFRRMVVACDDNGRLLGSLTDGDIRRCILRGCDLKSNIKEALNSEPIVAKENTSKIELYKLMRKNNVLAIPLVDNQSKFVRLVDIKEIYSEVNLPLPEQTFKCVVIMAGGLGSRLRPLTNAMPKPMLEIGGLPLLERQIKLLSKFGIKKIYLSVNYLSDIISNYFKDGSEFGLQIKYLRETNKTGTAGSLSLLDELPSGPFLVLNGDILTNFNINGLYEFHSSQKSDLTVASVDYSISVPYGTLNVNGTKLESIVEKPTIRYLCNAGIYVLNPNCIKHIPKGKEYNMTDLISSYICKSKNINVFPLHEYWMDIGNIDDLNKARKIFSN